MGHRRRRSSPLRFRLFVALGGALALGGWWWAGMPQIRMQLDPSGVPTSVEWLPIR